MTGAKSRCTATPTRYTYARDGGVHGGFQGGVDKGCQRLCRRCGVVETAKDGFKPEVIQQGAVVISVKLTNPQFQEPDKKKDRLNNAPVEGIVRSVVDEGS
jgi:DNA gyrase subunit B